MIDLHLHPAMTDFDPAVQKRRTPEEIRRRIESFMKKYKAQGVECIRAADGAWQENGYCGNSAGAPTIRCKAQDDPGEPQVIRDDPQIVFCGGAFTGANARDETYLRGLCESNDPWVKIFITGGIGAPAERAIDPTMSRERFLQICACLHENGKRIMVHCWGGVSLDWCIAAGVETIEHGVYLTQEQAMAMAERDIALVPTTAIYRLLAEKPDLFGVPAVFAERAKRVCAHHEKAVRHTLAAGVRIGLGTDFYADPELAEYVGYEQTVLQEYGLSAAQVWAAGHSEAERILKGNRL